MVRCALDPSIERQTIDGVALPLGVRALEPLTPKLGYRVGFEPADGDDEEGEVEAWPDRYVYEVVVPATRLPSLCRMLFTHLPGRVYPILDFLGHDAYREIDPYIAYEPAGIERFYDGLMSFGPFLFEDGLCGFGVMSESPFTYMFIDEHKVLTVRVEADEEGPKRIESVLKAFGLSQIEDPTGVDSVLHEHRGVLQTPDDRPDLLTQEEIVESLREEWRLTLNVDGQQNLDDDGNELGSTVWRCLTRVGEDDGRIKYVEVLLVAPNMLRAEELASEATEQLLRDAGPEQSKAQPPMFEGVVAADRITPDQLGKLSGVRESVRSDEEGRIIRRQWIE